MVGYRKKEIGHSSYDSLPFRGTGKANPLFCGNPEISARERLKTAKEVFGKTSEKTRAETSVFRKPRKPDRFRSAITWRGVRLGAGVAEGGASPARRVGRRLRAAARQGTVALSGTVEVVIRMLLAGHRSPWHADALRSRYVQRRDP